MTHAHMLESNTKSKPSIAFFDTFAQDIGEQRTMLIKMMPHCTWCDDPYSRKPFFVAGKHQVHLLTQCDPTDSSNKALELLRSKTAAVKTQPGLAKVHHVVVLHQDKLLYMFSIALLLLPQFPCFCETLALFLPWQVFMPACQLCNNARTEKCMLKMYAPGCQKCAVAWRCTCIHSSPNYCWNNKRKSANTSSSPTSLSRKPYLDMTAVADVALL